MNARFRDDTEVLIIADRLEQRGALSVVNANQLRASYYAGQGDSARVRTIGGRRRDSCAADQRRAADERAAEELMRLAMTAHLCRSSNNLFVDYQS